MSVNSKMTAIADAIRAKTGGTSTLTLDQMATDIAAIDTSENLDTVLAEQEALIAEQEALVINIQTALEGKAGLSVDTCTVVINGYHFYGTESGISKYWALCYADGSFYNCDASGGATVEGNTSSSGGMDIYNFTITIPNVVRNSIIVFDRYYSNIGTFYVSGFSGVSEITFNNTSYNSAFIVTAENGGTATINVSA